MIANIALALIATLVGMTVLAFIIRAIGRGATVTLVAQLGMSFLVGYGLLHISFLPLSAAIAVALLPLVVRAFAIAWFWWVGRNVLSGKYGEEARWAGELVEEGDEEFMRASAQLTDVQLREIGITAESKEELREQTVDRAEGIDDAS